MLFLILHLLFTFNESHSDILTCHWWDDFCTCLISYNCDHASLCTSLYSSLYSATSDVFIYTSLSLFYRALNTLLSHFHLLYWGCTLSCTCIEVKTLTQASARAGFLAIIHLVPLFFEEHLSLTANLIDMPLLIYQQVHSSMRIVTSVLSMFHVLVNVLTDSKLNFQDDFLLYDFVIRVFYAEDELKILTSFLERSFSRITYAFYLLISLKTLLWGLSEISSNFSFCCSICSVTSSIDQKALCTHLHSDCNWSFDHYDNLTNSADSFLQSGSWPHFCLSECYSA